MADFWDRVRGRTAAAGPQAAEIDPTAPYGAPNVLAMAVDPIKQVGDMYQDMRANPGIGATPEQAKAAFWAATSLGTSARGAAQAAMKPGEASLGMFVGPSAYKGQGVMRDEHIGKTLVATDMIHRGADPEYVRRTTGMMQGPDAIWRREITDHKSTVHPVKGQKEYDLPEFLEHRDLFEAYPHLLSKKVIMEPMKGTRGFFDPKTGNVHLANDLSPKEMREVVLHEIQHNIQELEGFARGTAPSALKAPPGQGTVAQRRWDAYFNTTGEREARDTGKTRIDMLPDERTMRRPDIMGQELYMPHVQTKYRLDPAPHPDAIPNIRKSSSQYYNPMRAGQPMGPGPYPLTNDEIARAIAAGWGT